MKKTWIIVPTVAVLILMNASPSRATKEFGLQFTETYTTDNENEAFVKLVEEAKCNVCHLQGESKKKRNEYGEKLSELLHKKDFPKKRFKEEPEKCKEEIEAAFKKVEEMEREEGGTFGERIKEGLLPGGDIEEGGDDDGDGGDGDGDGGDDDGGEGDGKE